MASPKKKEAKMGKTGKSGSLTMDITLGALTLFIFGAPVLWLLLDSPHQVATRKQQDKPLTLQEPQELQQPPVPEQTESPWHQWEKEMVKLLGGKITNLSPEDIDRMNSGIDVSHWRLGEAGDLVRFRDGFIWVVESVWPEGLNLITFRSRDNLGIFLPVFKFHVLSETADLISRGNPNNPEEDWREGVEELFRQQFDWPGEIQKPSS